MLFYLGIMFIAFFIHCVGCRCFRAGLGLLQPGHVCVHALCQRPPQHGRSHQQSEAPEAGPVGGLAGPEDEGGWQQRR